MAKKRYIPNVVNPVLETGKHWESQEFKQGEHNGEDLISRGPDDKCAGASYIIAIANGVVTAVAFSNTRGYYVELKHDNGMYSRYLHLKKGTIKVKKNQLVSKGQILGYEGESGQANGVHLHLAIFSRVAGVDVYVDPYDYLVGNKSFDNNWAKGKYKVLFDKYLRTEPKVGNNKIVYKTLKKSWKKISHPNKLGKARFNVGAEIELIDFIVDKNKYVWARCKTEHTPVWLCVKDNTGNQVVKIG